MSTHELEREKLIANFRKKFALTKGGIFTHKKRERIMGTIRRTGRGRKEADFWQDVRDYVRAALIDLRLFLEFADENDVSLVMTGESLNPVIEKLVSSRYPVKKDLRIADIANVLIQNGFRYLYYSEIHDITLSHKRTMNEALDLANYLVQSYLPSEERRYVSGSALP
jgi:hypothetical protein